jgi:hypothetical protein
MKHQTSNDFYLGEGGATHVVSSNQQSNGIVWAVNRQYGVGGVNNIALRAYDANDVTQSFHPTGGWLIGTWKSGRAFVVPTVMNGKVYVACEDHVGVFY